VALGPDGSVLGYTIDYVMVNNAMTERHVVYVLPPHGPLRVIPQPSGSPIMVPRALGAHGEIAAVFGYDGYVRVGGIWRLVGDPGEVDPDAINARGQITGIADDNAAFLGDDHGGPVRLLATLPCGCAAIGRAISPTGEVVGDAEDHAGIAHAAIFPSNGGPPRLLPFRGIDEGSAADAVGANGLIAGDEETPSGTVHLFRYDGAMHDLGIASPGLPTLTVAGMDAAGRIVGTALEGLGSSFAGRAFVEHGGGIEDLTTLAGLPEGEVIISAIAVNPAGLILVRADLGHGAILALVRPTRADAGGLADATADFAHVTWQPSPTPIPTIGPSPTPLPSPTPMASPPPGILGPWKVTNLWLYPPILRLHAAGGLRLTGTITEKGFAGPLTYPVTGAYIQPPTGATTLHAGGSINLTWQVPTTTQVDTAGNYQMQAFFTATFHPSDANIVEPNAVGGVGLLPFAASTP